MLLRFSYFDGLCTGASAKKQYTGNSWLIYEGLEKSLMWNDKF